MAMNPEIFAMNINIGNQLPVSKAFSRIRFARQSCPSGTPTAPLWAMRGGHTWAGDELHASDKSCEKEFEIQM
jgi:hypothetical protein